MLYFENKTRSVLGRQRNLKPPFSNSTFVSFFLSTLYEIQREFALKHVVDRGRFFVTRNDFTRIQMDPKLVRIPLLTAARCKFDGLLQQIAERMDEMSGDEGAPEDVKPTDMKQHAGVFQKPVKKKMETTAGTVITKIQDCSLDMALFNDSSVLYPMARAWCKNDNSREWDDSSSSDEEEQDDQRIVTMMPPPHQRGDDVPRIPSGLPPHGCDVIPIATDGDDLPDAGYLLQEHLLRWKIVRQQWREASALNEARYFESCEILAKCQAIEESSPEPQQDWDGIEPLA